MPTAKEAHEFLFWEFRAGQEQHIVAQAIRTGDWKAVRLREGEVELYHLADDPYERHNVASEHPEMVARMEEWIAASSTPLLGHASDAPPPNGPP